jgi:hypothetical protein
VRSPVGPGDDSEVNSSSSPGSESEGSATSSSSPSPPPESLAGVGAGCLEVRDTLGAVTGPDYNKLIPRMKKHINSHTLVAKSDVRAGSRALGLIRQLGTELRVMDDGCAGEFSCS